MTSGKLTGARQKSWGDAAVDGLFAGVGAGIAMVLYLVLAGFFAGENALVVLARFASGANASPIVGALTHLAVSGVYGALFAVLLRAMPFLNRAPRWLSGLAFGIILFTIAQAVVLPGTQSALRQIAPLNFLIAHLLFGLGVGVLLKSKA